MKILEYIGLDTSRGQASRAELERLRQDNGSRKRTGEKGER